MTRTRTQRWRGWIERFDGLWQFVLESRPINMRALERAQVGFKLGFLIKAFDYPPEKLPLQDVTWRQLVKEIYQVVVAQENREREQVRKGEGGGAL